MSISEADVVEVDAPRHIQTNDPELSRWLFENFSRLRLLLSKGVGVTGSFTTVDGKTIDFEDGIIKQVTT